MKRLLMLVLLMEAVLMGRGTAQAQSEAREAGYLYLSPVPQAPFVSAQTRYVLVRFEDVTPSDVTNLTTDFITVTGTNDGPVASADVFLHRNTTVQEDGSLSWSP